MSLAVKLLLSPLLVAQAVRTRRRAVALPEPDGARSGRVGAGPALRLLIVGDSSAAGVGVRSQDDALSGHLTRTLARLSGRTVDWQLLARAGLTTAQALAMLRASPPDAADVAVIALDVNDVVNQVSSQRAVNARKALAEFLRHQAGAQHVMFSPLPPMHDFPLLPQPLRWVSGRDPQRHDHAQARWAATRNDTWHVPIAVRLAPGTMAEDGFHPGEPVYRRCGEALATFIATVLWPAIDIDIDIAIAIDNNTTETRP